MTDAARLIERIETYFRGADTFDTDLLCAQLTPGCVIEVITHGARHAGRDEAIRPMFEARAKAVREAWHGNFRHVADAARGRVVTRFDVRRTNADGRYIEMDNINFFEFEGDLIHRIAIWMSGENSLVHPPKE